MKVAVTAFAADRVTLQAWVPEHPALPLQPAKANPALGVAVKTTTVPDLKLPLHLVPQLMPEPVTTPLPVVDTVSGYSTTCCCTNFAVIALLPFNEKLQAALVAQSGIPLQPENVYPVPATALSTILEPELADVVQVEPQLIPEPVIVPVPTFVTVTE